MSDQPGAPTPEEEQAAQTQEQAQPPYGGGTPADPPETPSGDVPQTQGDPNANPIPAAGEGAVPETVEGDPEDPEVTFRNEQLAAAAAQGIAGDQAVPERRPQASQTVEAPSSPLTQKLEEAGVLNTEAMPKSAYDAADDPARKEKTAGEGMSPAPSIGTVILVTAGVHEGRRAAVLRVVSYPSPEERLKALSGDPAQTNYAIPAEIEVSFRGDDRDGERAVLDLTNQEAPHYAEYQIVPSGFAGRSSIVGSL